MIGPSTPYLIALTVSAVIAAALAVYAWRCRPAPGAASFALLMLAVAEWSLVSALRMGSTDLPTKIFWAQVRYVGVVVVPAAWLAFALQYTSQDRWLKPRTIALLAIEPVVVLALVWTNDLHHLIWTGVHLDFSGGFPGWEATHGAGYWLHAVYSYLLVAIGALLLIRAVIRTPRTHLYRRQISALLIGALAPVIGNTISVFWNPLPWLDLTPIGFIIAGLAAAWGLYRTRLFDLVPVARDAVMESMGDGVIVLDDRDRVVDLNPTAQRLLGRPASEIIGQPATQAFTGQADLLAHFGDMTTGPVGVVLNTGETQRDFDLNTSPLPNRRGRLILIHDITERKQAVQLAQRRAAELDMLNDVGRALAGTLNVDELLEIIYQQVQRVLYADNLYIALYDEAADTVNFAYVRFRGERQTPVRRKAGPEGLTEHVIRTRQPLFLQGDVDAQARKVGAVPRSVPLGTQTRAWLGVPMICGEQTLGMLSIQHYEDPYVYDETQVRLLQAVANQAALALRNAQLFKEVENERRIAEALAQLAQIVNSTLNLSEVLNQALAQLAQVISYDSSSILLAEPPGLVIAAGRGFAHLEQVVGSILPREKDNIAYHVMRDQRARMVPDVQQLPEWGHDRDDIEGAHTIRAWIGAPLVVQGQSIGLLTTDKYEPDFYTEEDRKTVAAFATQIATAMQNARLYQAVQRGHSQLAAILNDTTDAVIVLDLASRVLLLNPAAERYLAVQAQQVVGEPVASLGMDGLLTALAAAQRAGGPVLQEIVGRGGRTLYTSISPVRDVGWVVVMQDITHLKELDRLRTEWVAAVSHDMKSPLAAIQVSASLLEVTGSLTPEQREILDVARSSIARLRLLVTEVLDLALLEAQPLLQAGPVSLHAVIATALGEMRPLLADRQHALIADLPPELPAVRGDASQLERVLVNLLNNAVKYTPVGGRIAVRARPQDSAVRVEVSDSGRGIPIKVLPHLFDRFYRVPGVEEEIAGAGLGLSIVKTIIEKHGGRVWVESEPEKGSTFGFTVPIWEGTVH